MTDRLITAGGVLLALLVAVGTAAYVHGVMPPYPCNQWAFQGLFLVCLVYGLAFGRGLKGRGPMRADLL